MVEEIKELRIKIDGLAQLTKSLKPISVFKLNVLPYCINSKEIEKAVESLFLAKAWLGKVLAELGTTNPYGSGYKTKEDIVPTQEVAKNLTVNLDGGWQEMNHIERVDLLRQEIEKLTKLEYISSMTYQPKNRLEAIARTNTYNHLSEARFWLGFEMQRIKEQ